MKGLGADSGDPNVSAEEIMRQANAMQKQLLELRIDPNKANEANEEISVLKK